jgi:hypothetical protein
VFAQAHVSMLANKGEAGDVQARAQTKIKYFI